MRAWFLSPLVAITVLGLTLVARVAEATDLPGAGVLVTAETPRPVVYSCEPAILDVTILNRAGPAIRFKPFYGIPPSGSLIAHLVYESEPLVHGQLQAWVRAPGTEEFRRHVPPFPVDALWRWRDSLDEGESRRVPVAMLTQASPRQPFVFEAPGTYAVKIVFAYECGDPNSPVRETVQSAPVEITVVAADGRDAEALVLWRQVAGRLESLRSCGQGQALVEDFWRRQGAQPGTGAKYAPFDTLRAEYPDTIYGQYCLYFATFQTPGAVTMLGTPPKEKYAENTAVIESILSRNPDFPLADRAKLEVAQYKLGLSESIDANGQVTRDEAQAAEVKAILQELVQSGKKTIATELARQRLERMNKP